MNKRFLPNFIGCSSCLLLSKKHIWHIPSMKEPFMDNITSNKFFNEILNFEVKQALLSQITISMRWYNECANFGRWQKVEFSNSLCSRSFSSSRELARIFFVTFFTQAASPISNCEKDPSNLLSLNHQRTFYRLRNFRILRVDTGCDSHSGFRTSTETFRMLLRPFKVSYESIEGIVICAPGSSIKTILKWKV